MEMVDVEGMFLETVVAAGRAAAVAEIVAAAAVGEAHNHDYYKFLYDRSDDYDVRDDIDASSGPGLVLGAYNFWVDR